MTVDSAGMPKQPAGPEIREAVDLPRKHGIAAPTYGPKFTHKTFIIDTRLLKRMYKLQAKLGWKIGQCANNAIELWLNTRDPDKAKTE